jgi:glutamate-1-semialdehyde 2,1-aminomutase
VIPAAHGFLDSVGRQAREAGALFVVDEVQSLRNALGGHHAELTTPPDLVLLGKIIGGGLPVGAVAGRADLLLLTVESRGGFAHSGTFNGNPAVAAAGLASLEALDASAIAALNAHAERLATAIDAAGGESGVPVSVTRAGSIMHVHLSAEAPGDAAAARAIVGPAVAALHLLLLGEGVYAAPRGMLNLSTAMTDADLEIVATGYRRALKTLAGA